MYPFNVTNHSCKCCIYRTGVTEKFYNVCQKHIDDCPCIDCLIVANCTELCDEVMKFDMMLESEYNVI